MRILRDLIDAIRGLTAAVDALRAAVVANTRATVQGGGGGPGEEK